jgi:ribosome biogenesis GTPase
MAFKEGIIPVIVINKVDLAEPAIISEQIEAWNKISRHVIYTSAVTGFGIDKLSEALASGTSVIAGHSGVGKSSLLNRISPALNIRTGQISRYSGTGTHTTSRVNMFRLFTDGWVVDTPGLKDFGLAGVTRRDLHRYFPEFAPHEPQCQFGNCVHINEPGCAVKSIIEKADSPIAPLRYYSYTKIYKTLEI